MKYLFCFFFCLFINANDNSNVLSTNYMYMYLRLKYRFKTSALELQTKNGKWLKTCNEKKGGWGYSHCGDSGIKNNLSLHV